MTKKRRKPVSKRPVPTGGTRAVGDSSPDTGYAGWNEVMTTFAVQQKTGPAIGAGPDPRTQAAAAVREPASPGTAGPVPALSTAGARAPAHAPVPVPLGVPVQPVPAGSVVPPAADRRRDGPFHDLDPQGLAATYWIDTDQWKGPGELSVRFSGLKTDGVPGPHPEQFQWYEDVDAISAGIGRIAVTARVSDISAGTWQVCAEPVSRTGGEGQLPATTRPGTTPLLGTVHTRFAPMVHGPGVHLLSWPLLVCLGAVLAVFLEALFLFMQGVDPTGPVWLSVLANAVGVFGARIWWLALNRQPVRNFLKAGACIQGFLAGALGTLVIGALVVGWPVGRILDASAVGIFFGMTVGRPGCFFTGCCSGRPTSSRWGLWSSDRRIGRRRHPVQLYEAVLALLIGLGTLPLMLGAPPRVPGLVFIGSVMVYTVGRQLLFPLRMDTHTSQGRNATIFVCALILGADIVAAVVF